MVTYEQYETLYRAYEQARDLAALLGVLVVIAVALLIVVATLYADANAKRERLAEQLARQSDPARQIAMMRQLGEAGRREVQRLALEARQALGATYGGQR